MARDRLGRGLRAGGLQARRDPAGAWRRVGGGLPGQSQCPPLRPYRLPAVAAETPAHAEHLQRVVGGPVAAPVRLFPDVRAPVPAADPRHRPHRLLPHARRQSDGLERQPDDRTRHAAPAQGANRARQVGRDRSAPHGNRRHRQPAPPDPSGWRCLVPAGVVASHAADRSAARGGLCRTPGGTGYRTGHDQRHRHRIAGSRDRHPDARRHPGRHRVPRRPACRRLRPHGRVGAALGHAVPGPAATGQPGERQPGPRRRRTAQRCRDADHRAGHESRHAGPLAQPRARAARIRGRVAGGLHGRGDRHPRRRPGPRPAHLRGQSGVVDAGWTRARPRAGKSRVHGVHRHLHQRDHAPCEPDPAAGVATDPGPLRLDLQCLCRASGGAPQSRPASAPRGRTRGLGNRQRPWRCLRGQCRQAMAALAATARHDRDGPGARRQRAGSGHARCRAAWP